MIEKVLEATNLFKATRQVERNKGASGVDGMKTAALSAYIYQKTVRPYCPLLAATAIIQTQS